MYLIISGTNRKNSNARIVAEYYKRLFEQKGISAAILDLADLPKDFIFSALYENTGKNKEFLKFQDMIDEAEKLVFVVSEYNGSFPGVLKAFLDGLRYPDSLSDKKGALIGLSAGSMGGALAISHIGDILNYLGMYLLPQRPRLAVIDKALDEGVLQSRLYHSLIEDQIEALVKF